MHFGEKYDVGKLYLGKPNINRIVNHNVSSKNI